MTAIPPPPRDQTPFVVSMLGILLIVSGLLELTTTLFSLLILLANGIVVSVVGENTELGELVGAKQALIHTPSLSNQLGLALVFCGILALLVSAIVKQLSRIAVLVRAGVRPDGREVASSEPMIDNRSFLPPPPAPTIRPQNDEPIVFKEFVEERRPKVAQRPTGQRPAQSSGRRPQRKPPQN